MTHPACELIAEKFSKHTAQSGFVLYEGPSLVNGEPIVVIVTGLGDIGSANAKTGFEAQTWIMPADCPPTESTKTGKDASVCFHCDYRPLVAAELRAADPKGVHPICYVNTGRGGPLNVWCRWEAGQYEAKPPGIIGQIAKDRHRPIRLGSWGDPAAVPKHLWDDMLFVQSAHTGYTHQWREFPEYAPYLMASVNTLRERDEAKALGFRTYRVLAKGEEPVAGEIYCPSTVSTGNFKVNAVTGMQTRITCDTCQLCSGAAGRGLVDIAVGEARSDSARLAAERRAAEGQERTRGCGCGHPHAIHGQARSRYHEVDFGNTFPGGRGRLATDDRQRLHPSVDPFRTTRIDRYDAKEQYQLLTGSGRPLPEDAPALGRGRERGSWLTSRNPRRRYARR